MSNGTIVDFHTEPTWDLEWNYTINGSSIDYEFTRTPKNSLGTFGYRMSIIPGFVKSNGSIVLSSGETLSTALSNYKFESYNSICDYFKFYPTDIKENYRDSHIWKGTVSIPSGATSICAIVLCEGCGTEHNTLTGSNLANKFYFNCGFHVDANNVGKLGDLLSGISFKSSSLYNKQPRYNYTSLGNSLTTNTNPTNANSIYINSNRNSNRTLSLSSSYITPNPSSYTIKDSDLSWSVKSGSSIASISSSTLTLSGTGNVEIKCTHKPTNLSCSYSITVVQPLEWLMLKYDNKHIALQEVGNEITFDISNTPDSAIGNITANSNLATISGMSLRFNSNTPAVTDLTVTAKDNNFSNNSKTASPCKVLSIIKPILNLVMPDGDNIITKYDSTQTIQYGIDLSNYLVNSSNCLIYNNTVVRYKVNNRPIEDFVYYAHPDGDHGYTISNHLKGSSTVSNMHYSSTSSSDFGVPNDPGLTFVPMLCDVSHSIHSYGISVAYVSTTAKFTYNGEEVTLSQESDRLLNPIIGLKTFTFPSKIGACVCTPSTLPELLRDNNSTSIRKGSLLSKMIGAANGESYTDTDYKKYLKVYINGNRNLYILRENQVVANPDYEKIKYVLRIKDISNNNLINKIEIDPQNINISGYSIPGYYLIAKNIISEAYDNKQFYFEFFASVYRTSGDLVYYGDESFQEDSTKNFNTKNSNAQKLTVRYKPLDPVDSLEDIGAILNNTVAPINWTHIKCNPIDISYINSNGIIDHWEDRGIVSSYYIDIFTNNESARFKLSNNTNNNSKKSANYNFSTSNGLIPMKFYSATIYPVYEYSYGSRDILLLGPGYTVDKFVLIFSKLSSSPNIIYPKNNGYWHDSLMRVAIKLPEDPDYNYLSKTEQNNYKYSDIEVSIQSSHAGTIIYYFTGNPEVYVDKLHYYGGYSFMKSNFNLFRNVSSNYIIKARVKKNIPLPEGTKMYSDTEDAVWSSYEEVLINEIGEISDDSIKFIGDSNIYDISMNQNNIIKAKEIMSINNLVSEGYLSYSDYGPWLGTSSTSVKMEIVSVDQFRDKIIYMNDFVKLYNAMIIMTENFNDLYSDIYYDKYGTRAELPNNIKFPEFYNENIEEGIKSIIVSNDTDNTTPNDPDYYERNINRNIHYNYFRYIWNAMKKLFE